MKLNSSIRSQIVFLSSGLVIVSFLALVPYLLKKFRDDKSAYLYDQILDISTSNQNKTDQALKNFEVQSRILVLQGNFDTANLPPTLWKYSIFQKTPSGYTTEKTRTNTTALSQYSLDQNTNVDFSPFNTAGLQNHSQEIVSEYENVKDIPLVTVFLNDKRNEKVHAFKFVAPIIDENYLSTNRYSTLLFKSAGETIQNRSGLDLDPSLINSITSGKSDSGAVTKQIKNKEYVIGYSKHPSRDLLSLTLISQEEVFSMVSKLIRKTIGFAGIVLSIAIFFGAIIAKNLISPINTLIAGTREISQKNYNHKIEISGNNEFKELSESFNQMGSEISKYIEEVKDKARIEKELEVAELVQKSFFPSSERIMSEHLEIVGFFESASECGGDWWGVKRIGNQTLFYMGDATGHGVPAALITSAANSCSAILPRMLAMNPHLSNSPGALLEIFNDSICESGGNIHMTLFLGIFDHETQTITYANASHHPPFIYKWSEKDPTKSDLKPLIEAEGFRLGHKRDAKFTEAKVSLEPKDVLYLFTDGVIEVENPEKQVYGEGRFLKNILQHAKSDLMSQKKAVLEAYNEHRAGAPAHDDISLLFIKRKSKS